MLPMSHASKRRRDSLRDPRIHHGVETKAGWKGENYCYGRTSPAEMTHDTTILRKPVSGKGSLIPSCVGFVRKYY